MASRLDEQVAAWCRVNGWTDLRLADLLMRLVRWIGGVR